MENIICEAFWGIGDRDWTIMFFFFNASLLYDDFVVLEYKYNIMLTILFNINS